MTASTWLIIAIILFTLAGALFIAAVIMFFVMNIPGIIGDLSGRTLAKGIQNIRSENAYANSKSARAANRRNNPNRQFSIGNEYPKEKGYTLTSLAHASRRLDRNTVRESKIPPKTSPGGTSETLSPLPESNKFTGRLGKSTPQNENAYRQDNYAALNNAGYAQNSAPSNGYNDEYTRETSVLNNANDEYTQATTVLNNANDEYTQATTVLNNANDEYTQATTVLNNANDEYTQATTVLNNANDEYTQATTVLNNANDEYTQATTVLNNANDEYTQSTTVLNNSNDEYTQSTTVLDSYYNEYTQGTTVLSNSSNDGSTIAKANEDYYAAQSKPESNLPLGFRVVRRVSVTHCNEVL